MRECEKEIVVRETPLEREIPKELVEYVEFVLDICDKNIGSLYGIDYSRQAYHIAAVKPYGLEERDTWMLFATMEHDLRWCGNDVNRLCNLYHKALVKCAKKKKSCYKKEKDGTLTELKMYDWGKYVLKEILSGKSADGRKI